MCYYHYWPYCNCEMEFSLLLAEGSWQRHNAGNQASSSTWFLISSIYSFNFKKQVKQKTQLLISCIHICVYIFKNGPKSNKKKVWLPLENVYVYTSRGNLFETLSIICKCNSFCPRVVSTRLMKIKINVHDPRKIKGKRQNLGSLF